MAKICSVDRCGVKHHAKGFCKEHWGRWKRHGNPLHISDSKEISNKLSKALKGRKFSKEHRENISKSKKGNIPWNLGRKHSLETRKKISKANKGKKRTEEDKKKMSESRKNPSEEFRKKMSEIVKGRKFSESHKMKISQALKGHKASEETRKKISEAGKGRIPWNLGRKHSEITRKKISEAVKGRRPWNLGVKQTEEHRQKNIATHKGQKVSEATRQKLIKFHNTPERKQLQREIRAKQKFPIKDTKPELLIQSILKKHGISFKKHYKFKLSDSYHQADIVIEPNYVIEVFGDYWHYNPKEWEGESKSRRKGKKVKDVWEYDKYVIDGMKEQGYKVLVVWESELKNELEKTTKKILKFVRFTT